MRRSHTFVVSGRRPVKKEDRVGQQIACTGAADSRAFKISNPRHPPSHFSRRFNMNRESAGRLTASACPKIACWT